MATAHTLSDQARVRPQVPVAGWTADGHESLRAAFARSFSEHGELGASFALYREGSCVADLHGGLTDSWTGQSYPADGLQTVFSVTKGVVASAVAVAVEDGLIDLDRPLAALWPEFAAHGKGRVSVAGALAHRAGVAAVGRLALSQVLDHEHLARAVAAAKPLWEPGRRHGYHAITFGTMAEEIFRRATGQRLAAFVRRRLVEPLGLDLHLGVGPAQAHRVVPLSDPPPSAAADMISHLARGARALYWRAVTLDGALDGPSLAGVHDRADIRAAGLPAAGAVTNARSLARLFASLVGAVDGRRLVSPETVRLVTRPRSEGIDRVLGIHSRFGTGFGLESRMFPFGSPTAFGHTGVSGSLAWADPATGTAFAYVTNRLSRDATTDPRPLALVRAVHDLMKETS